MSGLLLGLLKVNDSPAIGASIASLLLELLKVNDSPVFGVNDRPSILVNDRKPIGDSKGQWQDSYCSF